MMSFIAELITMVFSVVHLIDEVVKSVSLI